MAMQNVFNILVDLKVAKPIPQPLVTQNDSVVFILEVMQDGVPFDLTDTTIISLAHTRKDQTVVVTPGTKVGNKATFALGTNETSVTGAVTAKAQFYDADGRVSTLSFSYQVGLDPTGSDYVPSVVEQTLIQVVMADAQAKIDELSAVDVVELSQQLVEMDNEKADKTYVDTELNDIGVTQINKNYGLIDQTYLTPELIGQIAGTAPVNAVVTTDSLLTKHFVNKSIAQEKTGFLNVGTNLFNKGTITQSKSISTSTGLNTDNASFVASDFIPILPSTVYMTNSSGIKAYYAKDKTFISGVNLAAGIFTTPATAYYVRVSVSYNLLNTGVAQINLGNVLLPYEDYKLKIDNFFVNGNSIENLKVKSHETDFVEIVSNNIFNRDHFVSDTTLDASGNTIAGSGYFTSMFTDVEPSTTYKTNGFVKVAFYDKAKVFISLSATNATLTTPSNAKYLRGVYYYGQQQINKGDTLLPYDSYAVRVKGVVVENPTTGGNAFIIEDKFVIDGNVEGVYSSPVVAAQLNADTLTTAQVYAMYDSLVATYPSYVTRTLLGANAQGSNIYRYDFKPADMLTVEKTVKTPKMILISGVHSERAGLLALYNAMKNICENWSNDDLLETLRWNVKYIVVPVVNPYVIDNGGRKNGNGVDIARNFPTGWSLGSDPLAETYGGTAPLSELETQYVDTILKANKDAILFTSFHNFFAPVQNNLFIWQAGATQLQVNVGKKLISKMTRKWKKENAWLPQDETTYFGYANDGAPLGSEGRHAASYGIHAGTFEIGYDFYLEPNHVPYSSVVLTLGTEAFINFLVLNLKTNVEYYNNQQ